MVVIGGGELFAVLVGVPGPSREDGVTAALALKLTVGHDARSPSPSPFNIVQQNLVLLK